MRNPIWKELQLAMRCKIDLHIMLLLEINGFKSYQSLKTLGNDEINEIEEFVKNGSMEDRIDEEDIYSVVPWRS